jgi:hypothetical protein
MQQYHKEEEQQVSYKHRSYPTCTARTALTCDLTSMPDPLSVTTTVPHTNSTASIYLIRSLNVCPLLQEQPNHLYVSLLGCQEQSCGANLLPDDATTPPGRRAGHLTPKSTSTCTPPYPTKANKEKNIVREMTQTTAERRESLLPYSSR